MPSRQVTRTNGNRMRFPEEEKQDFGSNPLLVRETGHYQKEYIQTFVEKWDELIDWDARAKSEGRFFVDILKAREKVKILDVATGTGFHSVQLLKAGFAVTSDDVENLTAGEVQDALDRDSGRGGAGQGNVSIVFAHGH